MAERTWLAVILCCLVWFGYIQWFAPKPPERPVTPMPNSAAKNEGTAPNAVAAPLNPLSTVLNPSATHAIKTNLMEIQFSEIGGKISQVSLNNYKEGIKREAPPIAPVSPRVSALSLGTLFTEKELEGLGTIAYRQEVEGNVVRYSQTSNGVTLSKEYKVNDGSYLVDVSYRFQFKDPSRKDWGFLLLPVGATSVTFNHDDPLTSWEVVSFQNDSITRKTTDSLDEGEKVLQGNTSWLAFGNRYFSTAVVASPELNPDVLMIKNANFSGGALRYPLRLKSDQKELTLSTKIFVGPKDTDALAAVPGLKRLIDYGMFSFLAYPMLGLLRFFYTFLHNYGLAIILLTVVVRAAFYPLSVKSSRSMKAMQKVQPQIQALKEKYKDDMQRFNQEQMALFKAHKVNPLGGCLPILVQIPVFIALYSVLASSIELFHAPFFGWLQDLSSKDPYYVFPALMGVAMFVQQKMTPMAGMDPMQQKMMLFMPVIMTFFMINLPSGLTVYFFLSTVLGILQQYVINREPGTAVARVGDVAGKA